MSRISCARCASRMSSSSSRSCSATATSIACATRSRKRPSYCRSIFPRCPKSRNRNARSNTISISCSTGIARRAIRRCSWPRAFRSRFTTEGLEKPEKEFWTRVRLAVRRGLSKDVALAALTSAPAEMFGVADRMGTIAPGRIANLVVASGDFFAEEANVLTTWVDGFYYDTELANQRDLRGTWEVTVEKTTFPLVVEGELEKPEAKLGGEKVALTTRGDRGPAGGTGEIIRARRRRCALVGSISRRRDQRERRCACGRDGALECETHGASPRRRSRTTNRHPSIGHSSFLRLFRRASAGPHRQSTEDGVSCRARRSGLLGRKARSRTRMFWSGAGRSRASGPA